MTDRSVQTFEREISESVEIDELGGSDGSEKTVEAGDAPSRRKMVLVAAAAAIAGIAPAIIGTKLMGGKKGGTGPRRSGFSPAEAGGFGSREESYVAVDSPAVPDPQASTFYASASEAAAATQVSVPTILATDDPVLHMLRRTTFGPTPELVEEAHTKGIDAWLAEQLAPESIPDGTADGVWNSFRYVNSSPGDVQANVRRYAWDAMLDYTDGTLARQIWSQRQLYEVMVDFWSDHLHVPIPGNVWDVGPAYHNDVIRTHALGSFTDMLLAAMSHPGMLRYLDNTDSKKEAVNENLGRELLELHTVGVGSGYTEDDVRNSAYILTGRTEYREDSGQEGIFRYEAERHWVGPVHVMGFQHENASAEGGMALGDEYLRFLAAHPATAYGIARKLAVRFVSDDPPASLVDRLTKTYQDSGSSTAAMLDTLFRSGELWAAVGQKTRRPLENYTATARALGVQPGPNNREGMKRFGNQLGGMGHRPLSWPSPNGYPDVRPAWRSASGLLRNWNAHTGIVQGWDEGLTYTAPRDLVVGRPSATVGEYVDSLCQRLCLQTFRPEHRDALIGFVGTDQAASSAQAKLPDIVQHLAPVVLHSPYFALR